MASGRDPAEYSPRIHIPTTLTVDRRGSWVVAGMLTGLRLHEGSFRASGTVMFG